MKKMQQVDFSSLYFGTPVAILSSQNLTVRRIWSDFIMVDLEKHIVFRPRGFQ